MLYEVITEVRMISNLETNQEKLLQIVMLGQPERTALMVARTSVITSYSIHYTKLYEVVSGGVSRRQKDPR